MRLPPARATTVLVGATVAAWGLAALTGMGDALVPVAAFVPARMTGALVVPGAVPAWLTPVSATLLHAGVLHLAFNMLMLGFCGRYLEPSIGARGIVILYLIGAFAAAGAQYAVAPGSPVPMIGASGAVSALFAGYALLYGERRGRIRDGRLGAALQVLWLAAAWIGLQLLISFATFDGRPIAAAAHVGGFLAGLALAKPLLRLHWRGA